MGITGFYCKICRDIFPDSVTAEKHVLSEDHNLKYKVKIVLLDLNLLFLFTSSFRIDISWKRPAYNNSVFSGIHWHESIL